MYTNGLADDEHKAFETCIEDTNINMKIVHFVDLRHTINLFPLLHRAYCQVTQLLYQLMNLYKIYTLKH